MSSGACGFSMPMHMCVTIPCVMHDICPAILGWHATKERRKTWADWFSGWCLPFVRVPIWGRVLYFVLIGWAICYNHLLHPSLMSIFCDHLIDTWQGVTHIHVYKSPDVFSLKLCAFQFVNVICFWAVPFYIAYVETACLGQLAFDGCASPFLAHL